MWEFRAAAFSQEKREFFLNTSMSKCAATFCYRNECFVFYQEYINLTAPVKFENHCFPINRYDLMFKFYWIVLKHVE